MGTFLGKEGAPSCVFMVKGNRQLTGIALHMCSKLTGKPVKIIFANIFVSFSMPLTPGGGTWFANIRGGAAGKFEKLPCPGV